MRTKTFILAFAILFIAGITFAQDNPFAAFFGEWKFKMVKAEPALPNEEMDEIVNLTIETIPGNNGIIFTYLGSSSDENESEETGKEFWLYDKNTKKIYGLNDSNGNVLRIEGNLGTDGKSVTTTMTYVANPKQFFKLDMKIVGGEISFTQALIVDDKQVQYVEGKGTKK